LVLFKQAKVKGNFTMLGCLHFYHSSNIKTFKRDKMLKRKWFHHFQIS